MTPTILYHFCDLCNKKEMKVKHRHTHTRTKKLIPHSPLLICPSPHNLYQREKVVFFTTTCWLVQSGKQPLGKKQKPANKPEEPPRPTMNLDTAQRDIRNFGISKLVGRSKTEGYMAQLRSLGAEVGKPVNPLAFTSSDPTCLSLLSFSLSLSVCLS